MKNNPLNLAIILCTSLLFMNNAIAKNFEYKSAIGVGFGQQTVKGAFRDISQTGIYNGYDIALNSESNINVFDIIFEGKFKLFDKFLISPQARIPINDQIENNISQSNYYWVTDTAYNENYNLNQKFSTDYILDLKFGYLINNKTNIYGSIGYIKSNSKTNLSYVDNCNSGLNLCADSAASASNSINQSWNDSSGLMTYGFGIETQLKNNLLLDLNYIFSEKQSYNIPLTTTNSVGDSSSKRFIGNYQYNKLSIALKYLF